MLKQAIATATITYEDAGRAFVDGASDQQADFLRGMLASCPEEPFKWSMQCRAIEGEFSPSDLARGQIAAMLRDLAEHLEDPATEPRREELPPDIAAEGNAAMSTNFGN